MYCSPLPINITSCQQQQEITFRAELIIVHVFFEYLCFKTRSGGVNKKKKNK